MVEFKKYSSVDNESCCLLWKHCAWPAGTLSLWLLPREYFIPTTLFMHARVTFRRRLLVRCSCSHFATVQPIKQAAPFTYFIASTFFVRLVFSPSRSWIQDRTRHSIHFCSDFNAEVLLRPRISLQLELSGRQPYIPLFLVRHGDITHSRCIATVNGRRFKPNYFPHPTCHNFPTPETRPAGYLK